MKTSLLIIINTLNFVFISISLNAQTLTGNIITGGGVYDGLEEYVGINDSGDRIILSAALTDINGMNNVGAALVYELINGNWQQLGQDLEGQNENERYGQSVELAPDGNRIAVGGNEKIQVFDLVSDQWQQVGNDITVPGISGTGVLEFSLNAEILGVGFTGFSVDKTVRVYKLINNIWTELGDGIDGSQFGSLSLSNSGERLAVEFTGGSLDFDIRTFDFVNNSWTEVASVIESEIGDVLTEGFALSANGNRLVVTFNEDATEMGFVKTFDYQNNDWVETIPQIPIVIDNSFGVALRLSYDGTIFILGTSDDNPISGVSDVFVYALTNSQWQLAGSPINGSADDERANGQVDITGDGQHIIMAGNETPGGQILEFVAGYDLSAVLAVRDDFFQKDIRLYPNPTNGHFSIDLGDGYSEIKVSISNVLGQIVSSETFNNTNTLDFDLKIDSGIYLVRITTSEGKMAVLKVIKN